jgi:putative membrane protein
VPTALPAPRLSGLFAHWAVQPLAVVLGLALLGWYVAAVRSPAVRGGGRPWPAGRTAAFAVGIALFGWTTCGWPEAYRGSLYWVWTAQALALLLVVPVLLLAGGLLELARLRHGPGGHVQRVLNSRLARVLGNPLVGPALVPVLSAVLFFGPVPEWVVRSDAVAWIVQLLLVVVGAGIVLPLLGGDMEAGSLAVGLSLAIGSLELVLDAIPGVALRLRTGRATDYFTYRAVHGWTPSALRDQQTAGSILWCVAELIDLPFLLLVFRRWLQADARDAAQIDAVLEAERLARSAPGADEPWWLTDPQLRGRARPDDPPR